MGYSVANALPPLKRFLRVELCCPGAMMRRWAPQTRYMLQGNTVSTIKDLIIFQF